MSVSSAPVIRDWQTARAECGVACPALVRGGCHARAGIMRIPGFPGISGQRHRKQTPIFAADGILRCRVKGQYPETHRHTQRHTERHTDTHRLTHSLSAAHSLSLTLSPPLSHTPPAAAADTARARGRLRVSPYFSLFLIKTTYLRANERNAVFICSLGGLVLPRWNSPSAFN